MTTLLAVKPRFSGHETFACRFAWLPKAVRLMAQDSRALSSDDAAMLELGLGKNMVRALRFWLDAFGVARLAPDGWQLQPFGEAIFAEKGLDPFIERLETQWLLHWQITAATTNPLFAWRHLFFRRLRSDFTRSELLADIRREGEQEGYEHSSVTLLQHIDVLLHSYAGGSVASSPEDALDGPLVDLRLIGVEGRRRGAGAKAENVYALRRIPLSEVGAGVVNFAIEDFWARRRAGEGLITFRDLAYAEGSPGATLRLNEDELREHLERGSPHWTFRASGDAGALVIAHELSPVKRLREIYA